MHVSPYKDLFHQIGNSEQFIILGKLISFIPCTKKFIANGNDLFS